MEELHSGSGLLRDGKRGSIHSVVSRSSAGLISNAENQGVSHFSDDARIQRRTSAGVFIGAATSTDGDELHRNTDAIVSEPASAAAAAAQPFYKRRWFIVSQLIMIPLGIALLFILLFPIVRAIAQSVVTKSTLNVAAAAITDPRNDTFHLSLQGYVAHTGVINAKIMFTEPINVSWVESKETVTPLGTMTLDPLTTKNKRATIDQSTTFFISDQNAFGRFAAAMITSQNFTWRMESDNLHVQALKFPLAKGIKFNKDLTLNGLNSFDGNVVLQDLQLPGDSPGGGIKFAAVTQLNNPSPFSLTLGTIIFDMYYQNVSLGSGTGYNAAIGRGLNNITLSGVLVQQSEPSNLAAVSQLFTSYINSESSPVIAVGRSTLQSDNVTVSWLSQGLKALQLNVPFMPSSPIDPVRSITIGTMALAFDESTAWDPAVDSNTVQATLQLPFGFGVAIGEISNDFNLTQNGSVVVGLATPLGASTSNISVLAPDDTAGYVNITLDSKLTCLPENHQAFSLFNAELTSGNETKFRLEGATRAVANTSIGAIVLDPIKVNVSTSLSGLQGLKGFATIEGVDVMGGTSDGIILSINVTIVNPSNLNLSTGDITLHLFRNSANIGTVLLPNLTLDMGPNAIVTQSTFEANASPEGLQTLDDFVGKKDVQLSIAGFDGSTKVASLAQAFETLDINVTLPALKTNLLDLAALEILATTGRTDNISHVTVDLANPFSAGLDITNIVSTVTYSGVTLGTINTNTNFTSTPKSTTKSPTLNLNMNFDPPSLFTVTRALAVEAGLDVAPLDGIVSLGGIQYLSLTGSPPSSQRRDNLYTNFNLPTFVQTAFKQLKSDVELAADVTIGSYHTTLQYNQTSVPTTTDDSLNLILPILAMPIVQRIVGGATLSIDTVLIKDPQNTVFVTSLKGGIGNAGPFDAVISFGAGLTVRWSGAPIGVIKMSDIKVIGDVGGAIDVESTFEVADITHLADFTKVLLTEESFDWEIAGENLTVSALGINVTGISLPTKKVTLKGFNGLKDGVKINSFDLPSNDPAGGIHLTIDASVTNPSQVGVELSSIGFNTFVGDVMIAPVASNTTVTLAPGSTSPLALVGRLVPQDSDAGLSTVSGVFNRFIHGMDSQVVVQGVSAGPSDVTWLNDGIRSLQVATVLPNQGELEIIKSISLNQLELLFTEDTAYNPTTSSDATDTAFTLPFAFPIDITALGPTINTGFQGHTFAQLAIPQTRSTTDIENRIIHLTFNNTPFAVFDDQHATFDNFVAATTLRETQILQLSGAANADAKTAVGTLSLTNITFSVDSSIQGLQGLNTKPVVVSSLDVNHGYPDYLLIKVDSVLFNPSNLTIGTGDVAFALQFQDETIGSADIKSLLIIPGNDSLSIDVHYSPQGSAQAAGSALLENYLQGVDSDTVIAGTTDSTPIESLKAALSQIRLSPVTIPALHQGIITAVSLIFPIDIVQTGIASTTFTLSNPFTASINLIRVEATAVFHQLNLGKINNVDISSSPIRAEGHSNVTSSTLPLEFNMDPATIIQLLDITSQENGVDIGPLASLFQFVLDNPTYHPAVNSSVDTNSPTCVSGNQFDIDGAILRSLAGLKVNLAIDSSVKLDDYATDLSFNQAAVPVVVDKTVLNIVGAVAGPIAQHLVDGASLIFTEANITNISDNGFDLALRGSLTDIGPLDALITFLEPVTVTWQGNNIAKITLPPICAAANTGVPDYQTNAKLEITDQAQFTAFATYLLHNPSFDWIISTPSLRLVALGTIFDKVSLTKTVSFKAFNGLSGVTINNFQLPSDDPAGGIHIETDALIPSQAQLGIDLGTVGFQAYFEDTLIGPLSGSDLFLAADETSLTHLTGRIIPQSGDDLDVLGRLFSQYLAGDNQTLTAKGDFVQPTGSSSPVSWLSNAFKTLALDVTLAGQKLPVIQSIALSDLSVTMQSQDQAFAPPAGSNFTVAKYKNPFGFSLQVVEASENIILSSGSVDIAELKLPKMATESGVSTGNVVDLDISFSNQPLTSLNNDAFEQLFAQVTLKDFVDLNLRGTADVTARTTIGNVPIAGIPFDVPSSLKGIDSFGGSASLSNVSVTGSGGNGGSEYIVAPLTTTLTNPSNITLQTVDIALPVFYKDVMIGRAAIDPFNLSPGENVVPTEFHYDPPDVNNTIAQSFLTAFIQTGNDLALTIEGDSGSTPFASLQPALSGVRVSTSLKGMNQPTLITHINVYITVDTIIDQLVTIDFDVHNPLDTELVLEYVQSDAGVKGTEYAFFAQSFSSFVIPPGGTANSGRVPNVLLTKGAVAALLITPLGYLDIAAATTARIGAGGYQVPFLHLTQSRVPTTYLPGLGLSIDGLKAMAQNGNASSSVAPATATFASLVSTGVSAGGVVVNSIVSAGASVVPAAASAVLVLPSGTPAPVLPIPTLQNSPADASQKPSPTPAPAMEVPHATASADDTPGAGIPFLTL